MKEFSELNLPGDRQYSEDHQWVMFDGEVVRIGISDFVQDQLGDIIFVELPEIDDEFEAGDEYGMLEAADEVWGLFMPIGGKVVAVNEDLEEAAELLNEDPYETWVLEIEPTDPDELDELMDNSEYLDILGT